MLLDACSQFCLIFYSVNLDWGQPEHKTED